MHYELCIKKKYMKTPYYIVYEDRIERNLRLLRRVAQEADVKLIMACKA